MGAERKFEMAAKKIIRRRATPRATPVRAPHPAPKASVPLLSKTKTLRILEAMGADPDDFEERYAADTTRGERTISPTDIQAATAFAKDGNLEALMARMGVKSEITALKRVGRVLRKK